jgi:hypothetical protein
MKGPKQQAAGQQQKLLLLVCAAALAGLAAGYPELFIEGKLANGCTSHPAKALGRHETPVPDT